MNTKMLKVRLIFSLRGKHRLMAWRDRPSRITFFTFCGGGGVRGTIRSWSLFRPSIIKLPRLASLILSLEPPGIRLISHWSGLQLFKQPWPLNLILLTRQMLWIPSDSGLSGP